MDLNKLSKEQLIELNKNSLNHISQLEEQLNWYQQQINLLQKNMFGKKSEKTDLPEQLSLFDEVEIEQTPIKIEPELEEITYKRKKKKGKREQDLSLFPVERIIYDIEEKTCNLCNAPLRKVSENIRKELIYIPASYKVIEHVQYVYTCDACNEEKANFVKGKAPIALLPKSFLSASLASTIIYNKFCLSLPLYRQEMDYKRTNLLLTRQTMSNWLVKLYDYYLKDVQAYMHRCLLQMEYIGADETTVQVLREQGIATSTRSYMWAYKSGRSEEKQLVLFHYEPTRGHDCAKKHLEGYHQIVQSDGYQAYDKLEDVTQAGCMAHARRKFIEVLDSAPKGTDITSSFSNKIVILMNQLFHIEKETKDMSYLEITSLRQTKAKPIFDEIMERIHEANQGKIVNKKLQQAITYCVNQESKLRTYLDDGRIELSNNSLERAIRPFTVGRKNWLFSTSPHGARASSCYYSIVESAKLNKLNPQAYLEYILSILPNINLKDEKDLENIMPWSTNLPENIKIIEKS